jgi:hypothetical protein
MDENTGSWLGMVVAGRDHHPSTFVIEAGALTDFLNRTLQENFIALRYSK